MKYLSLLVLPVLLAACTADPLPASCDNNLVACVKTEEDFARALQSCRTPWTLRHNVNDFCENNLKWERNHGRLRFLDANGGK